MKAWFFSLGTNRLGKIVALLVLLSFAFVDAIQGAPVNAPVFGADKPVAKTNSAPASAKTSARSGWNKLTPAQQFALAPLAADWNKLDPFHKEKWLELANKFASMSPVDQARMQERMRAWAKLSPEQRRLARESYTRTKKLNAEQKSRQWEEYQQLPEEKKKQLAETVSPKKQIVNPPRPHNGKNAAQAKITPKHIPTKQPLPTAEAIQPSPALPIPAAP